MVYNISSMLIPSLSVKSFLDIMNSLYIFYCNNTIFNVERMYLLYKNVMFNITENAFKLFIVLIKN